MKKLFILLAVIAMTTLTGCTAVYELKIENDNFIENISLYESTDIIDDDTVDYFKNNDESASNNMYLEKYYEKDVSISNGQYKFSLKQNYNFDEYSSGARARECYDTINVVKTSGGYYISSSDVFGCLIYMYQDVDNVEVRITSDYKTIKSNADKIDGNTHIWKINNSNFKNKKIELDLERKEEEYVPYQSKYLANVLIIFGVIIAIISSILAIIFFKNKKANQM